MAVFCRTGGILLSGVLLCSCSTSAINAARVEFYKGNLIQAENRIGEAEGDDTNEVLFLMERGTILQAAGEYEKSSLDFIRAASRLKQLGTYSVSKGAASMVVNDNVQSYIGVPFERAMLHDLTALNHYARGDWIDGAVESRRIINLQDEDVRGNYPDDAFSRYIAGFGLAMVDDPSNAALQYRLAGDLRTDLFIDPDTGNVSYNTTTNHILPVETAIDAEAEEYPARLICFVLLGKSPSGEELLHGLTSRPQSPPYAELYCDGNYLGRSYNLTDVSQLAYATAQKEAVRKAAKTTSRIAMKEGAAQIFDHNDQELIGLLIRLIFIGLLEQPDTRRWETLPHWLQVATVPCPSNLTEFEAVIKTASGLKTRTLRVTNPIKQNGVLFVSFLRDLPQHTKKKIDHEKGK